MPEGRAWCRDGHTGGVAHRDLTSDRGHGQGEAGGGYCTNTGE